MDSNLTGTSSETNNNIDVNNQSTNDDNGLELQNIDADAALEINVEMEPGETNKKSTPSSCPVFFEKSPKGRRFKSARLSTLQEHQRRNHSSTFTSNQVAKVRTCYFCSKSSTQFSDLNIHMRQHTKEVPFKCGFCKKKYIRQQYLTLHIASHTNEKPFSCSQCNQEFKTNSHLKRHMVSHTKIKRYFCQFCSYGSYFKFDFNKHILKRHNTTSKVPSNLC
jgi:uncharacterized Zn-finger protein